LIFSVWAPAAKAVDLVLADRKIALQKATDGYWRTELDDARTGDAYRYAVDGGPAFPDPRSRWQPDGVHGSSRVIDVAELQRIRSVEFQPGPLRDAVIYELHVGTFTPEGTYAGALGRLQHLVDLGITHIELMPLATFPGARGWGYDGVDLYAPLPAYGTPSDLARFVSACHQRGLAVLLDVVYNHLGPDGNYLASFGPYFSNRVKTPWGEAINYDGPQSDAVRSYIVDNAVMWLEEYGFDGLRLDAVHAIFSFEAVHVLEDLAVAVRKLGAKLNRSFVLIAESDLNDPRLVRSPTRGGYGLTAHWADDFHHAVHRYFTGETSGYYADFHGLKDIATALRDGYVYQGQYSVYRRRRHGRRPTGVHADQIVICAQNHDQIGNRARGERLSMLLTAPRLKAIAALALLSPFVPLLFQGEEWGARTPFLYFTDHQDAELGRLVAEGRRNEFRAFAWQAEVPDPQARDTFDGSKLDWSELTRPEHAELLEWHRRLIGLRFDNLERVGNSRPSVKYHEAAQWLRFTFGGLLAVFNFGANAQHVPMAPGAWELVLGSVAHDLDATCDVPAYGTRIFKRRPGDEPLPSGGEPGS